MNKKTDLFDELEEEIRIKYSNSMFIGDIFNIFETYKTNFYDISKRCFLTFSTRDTEIFRARYLNGISKTNTYEKISSNYNLTRARIEQIVKSCVDETRKQLLEDIDSKERIDYLGLTLDRFFNNTNDLDAELNIPLINFINCNYETLPIYDKKRINSILCKIYKSLKRNYLNLGFNDYDYIKLVELFKLNLSKKNILELNLSNVTYCRLVALGLNDIYSLLEIQMEYLCSSGLLTKEDLTSIYSCFGENVGVSSEIIYIDRNKKLKYLHNLDTSNINYSFKTSCILNTFNIKKLGTIMDYSDSELIRKYGFSDAAIKELRYSIALLVGDIEDNSKETRVKLDYKKIDLRDLDLPYSVYKKLSKNGIHNLYDALICDDIKLNDIGEDVYHSIKLLDYKINNEDDSFNFELDNITFDEASELLSKYEYEKNKISEQILELKNKEARLEEKIVKLQVVMSKKQKKR